MSLRYLDSEAPLQRYLEIKAEIKRLNDELQELQPLILNALWEEPEQQAEYQGYALTIQERRSFTYSEHVKALEAELKALRKQEEASGAAQLKRHTSYVVVRSLKID